MKKYSENFFSCNQVEYLQYRISEQNRLSEFFDVISVKDIFEDYKLTRDVMHMHDFNLIIWFRNEHGTHYVDFNKYEINGSCMFFLSPKNLHKIELDECHDGLAIVFSTDFLQHLGPTIESHLKYLLAGHRNGVMHCTVPQEAKDKIDSLVKAMKAELQEDHHDALKETCLASLLQLFFVTARRECRWDDDGDTVKNSQSFSTYARFVELVEQNFRTIHSVGEYAKRLSISSTLLTRYTKRHAKCVPSTIIDDRIILEAKRMLRFSPLRVKEIAQELGFNDPSYFNKFFKREVGVSPADFREID